MGAEALEVDRKAAVQIVDFLRETEKHLFVLIIVYLDIVLAYEELFLPNHPLRFVFVNSGQNLSYLNIGQIWLVWVRIDLICQDIIFIDELEASLILEPALHIFDNIE